MKDFSQQYLKKQDLPNNYDPFLYTTQAVRQQLQEMQRNGIAHVNIANLIAGLIIAPLTTITASLQLSVKPHKTIFEEPLSKSTQVAKINTALTLQQKRKMELMLRAGGQQKPYTAPVYEGYRGVIKGLSSQGWQAFYKGLLFRSIHQTAHYFAFFEYLTIGQNIKGGAQVPMVLSKYAKIYIIQSFVDTFFNFLHINQNRYILQNNISEFRVFRNASRIIRKLFLRKQVFIGSKYHFANNLIQTFIRFPIYMTLSSGISPFQIGAYYLSELIMYPLNTAFRRILCQSSDIPGMIPYRYSGLWHAMRLIASQEGVLGLYKGFGLHHVSMAIKLIVIATITANAGKFQTHQ